MGDDFTFDEELFRVAEGALGRVVTRAPAGRPRAGAVAVLGHATDAGESCAGARFAPTEIRRYLYRLPASGRKDVYDLGDDPVGAPPAFPSLRFGGGADALVEDADRLARAVEDLLVLQVAGRPRDLGRPHLRFGARDLAPADDVLTRDEWLDAGVSPLELATRRWPFPRARPTFLAIHLDAFTLPGVAEPSALGFTPNEAWPLFRAWFRRLDVRALGIYGLIPPLDTRGLTTDFAARLAHAFLHV